MYPHACACTRARKQTPSRMHGCTHPNVSTRPHPSHQRTPRSLGPGQAKLEDALPSEEYCATTGALCAQPFAETYQCMLTSVPNVRLEDECFGAFVPKFGCLSQTCARGMADMSDPQDLDFASPGCGLDKIADRMCDPLCMTPMSAMDGGDCLVVVSE